MDVGKISIKSPNFAGPFPYPTTIALLTQGGTVCRLTWVARNITGQIAKLPDAQLGFRDAPNIGRRSIVVSAQYLFSPV